MTLYKMTFYPNSISLNEKEFRIAIQGGYDTFDVTYHNKTNGQRVHSLIEKSEFMRGVVNAKMGMTKACFGETPKPYWVVRF